MYLYEKTPLNILIYSLNMNNDKVRKYKENEINSLNKKDIIYNAGTNYIEHLNDDKDLNYNKLNYRNKDNTYHYLKNSLYEEEVIKLYLEDQNIHKTIKYIDEENIEQYLILMND